MGKKSWYSKQCDAEAQRTAALGSLYRAMTQRELVAELQLIEADDRAMRLDRHAPQARWERIAVRNDLARAELAARRAAELDDAEAPTDAQLDDMDRFYGALNAAAADEVADLARERARIAARDAETVVSADVEPF